MVMIDAEAQERKPVSVDIDVQNVPESGPYDYPHSRIPHWALSRTCPEPFCYKRKIGRFYVFLEYRGKPIIM